MIRPVAMQRGFTIVTAIFMLVVMTLLAAAMVSFSTSQQMGSAADVLGTRAYLAARAGIEWGLYQVQATPAYNFGWDPSSTPAAPKTTDPNARRCPGGSTVATTNSFVPPAPTLAGFTVTVKCTPYPPDANGGPTVFQIDAVACNAPDATGACPGTPGSGSYVERSMRVTL